MKKTKQISDFSSAFHVLFFKNQVRDRDYSHRCKDGDYSQSWNQIFYISKSLLSLDLANLSKSKFDYKVCQNSRDFLKSLIKLVLVQGLIESKEDLVVREMILEITHQYKSLMRKRILKKLSWHELRNLKTILEKPRAY